MTTPAWEPGTLYTPGSLVRPRAGQPVQSTQPANGNFEAGDTGWTKGTGWSIGIETGNRKFDGDYSAEFNHTGTSQLESETVVPVTPGQTITARCQVQQGASSAGQAGARINIAWYDSNSDFISSSPGNLVDSGSGGAWHPSTVTGVAPANAAFANIVITAFRNSGGDPLWVDVVSWDYVYTAPDSLIFKAVQANAGYSANTEPSWPATLGQTVVDNEVTWEAVDTTRVIWEAHPILVSGSSEPTWPTTIGETVADGTIAWQAVSRRIEDEKCPNGPFVVLAASKIFCADNDIISFSATVNPLDWSSPNDAGYIPYGLNNFGSNDVTAMGLYRGNLVAFNSEGFQMWQIDQDPTNMAILDSAPIACTEHLTLQPVANDLVFDNPVGVRNIAIAGASTNLQAEGVGEPIDALVKAKKAAAEYEPFALYYPGAGQYWLVFGDEAFVLTINGAKKKSWSRYVFPEAITDWTLHGTDLYLRTETHKVWKFDETQTLDDVYYTADPVTVTAEIEGGSDILVTWTEADPETSPDIDFYTLFRSYNGGAYAAVATVDAGDPLEYLEEEPANGTYRYYVIVTNVDGMTNPQSNVAEITIAREVVLVAVATGQSTNSIMTSPDGVNWTLRTTPTLRGYRQPAYSPVLNRIVCPSSTTNVVLYSDDGGATWTEVTGVGGGSVTWDAACWDPETGLFVIGGGTNLAATIATSPDGVSWTMQTPAGGTRIVDLVRDARTGYIYACNLGGGARIQRSEDGVTWTFITSGPSSSADARIAAGPSRLVQCNSGDIGAWYSDDGDTWTFVSFGSMGGPNVYHDGSKFVVARRLSDACYTSADAETWTTQATSPASALRIAGAAYAPRLGLHLLLQDSTASPAGQCVLTSPSALAGSWTFRTTPAGADGNSWRGVIECERLVQS